MSNDHLLCVDRQIASESYKRFYYRDIQAIIIRPTNRTRNYNIAYAILMAIFILVGMAIGGGGLGFFIFLSLVIAAVMIVNSAKGPCCVCHLRTAVQTEELPSLGRLYNAEKAVAMLRPLIEQSQGTLAAEDVQNLAGQAKQVSVAPAALSYKARAPEKLKHDNGGLQAVLFWMVVADAIIYFTGELIGETAFGIAAPLCFCTSLFLSLACTIRQSQSDLTAAVKTTVWFILIFLCIDAFAVLFIAGGVAGVRNAERHRSDPFEAQPQLANFMEVASHPVFVGISGTVLLLSGVYGLSSLARFRKEYAQSQQQAGAALTIEPTAPAAQVAQAIAVPSAAPSVSGPMPELGQNDVENGPQLNTDEHRQAP
jgi:hypothetical protein